MFSLVFQPSVAIADTQALPACVDSDCNCSDFSTQEAAQTVLNAFPGDRFRLDGDKDGVACEGLPRTKAAKSVGGVKAVANLACPKSLNDSDHGYWYATEPEPGMSDFNNISMKAVFRNTYNRVLDFTDGKGSEVQVWGSPRLKELDRYGEGKLYEPKYTLTSVPSTKVATNGTLSYEVNFDLSDAPSEINSVAFRPQSYGGSVTPRTSEVESVTFTCN